jgi:hypothetical protein
MTLACVQTNSVRFISLNDGKKKLAHHLTSRSHIHATFRLSDTGSKNGGIAFAANPII